MLRGMSFNSFNVVSGPPASVGGGRRGWQGDGWPTFICCRGTRPAGPLPPRQAVSDDVPEGDLKAPMPRTLDR